MNEVIKVDMSIIKDWVGLPREILENSLNRKIHEIFKNENHIILKEGPNQQKRPSHNEVKQIYLVERKGNGIHAFPLLLNHVSINDEFNIGLNSGDINFLLNFKPSVFGKYISIESDNDNISLRIVLTEYTLMAYTLFFYLYIIISCTTLYYTQIII